MEFLQALVKENEINIMKISNYFESEYDKFNIKMKELEMNNSVYGIVTESDKGIIVESTISELGKKAVETIQSIIDVIKDFCKKIKDKIVSSFSKDKIKDIVKNADSDELKGKEVEIYKDEKYKEKLNQYIREMAKLERKLMNIKVSNKLTHSHSPKDGQFVVECNLIMREMDKLNEEYDKTFLDDNKDVIKMAAKNAIRFSEKQLDNIKVDYDAIEKGSDEILMQFKKDANGCDVPVKLNILQKMSNSIATRVRKTTQKMTTYKHKNLSSILALGTIITAVSAATFAYNKVPGVKDTVDKKAKEILDGVKVSSEKMQKENEELKRRLKKK